MTADMLATSWSELADKVVTLAKEFPADKFDSRPVPGIRSFADQLRHIAFWNDYVRKTLRHEEADGAANELPRDAYPTKAKLVPALRASFDGVTSEIKTSKGTPDESTLLSFIEHTGEHYGQLVVYCRLNGIVPPSSRGSE